MAFHLSLFRCQAVEKFGGIDILVSNAATNPVYGGLLDVSTPLLQMLRADPGCSFLSTLFLGEVFFYSGFLYLCLVGNYCPRLLTLEL